MHVEAMISKHPRAGGRADSALVHCVELCFDCAQTCATCAEDCLAENGVIELRRCIRLNLDCATVCAATGALASRGAGAEDAVLHPMLQACSEICRVCEEECRRHADRHEHCRLCADLCKECEDACRSAMSLTH